MNQIVDPKKVITHDISPQEIDTYDLTNRENKEQFNEFDIVEHWKIRAKRPDVQSVMSARHSLQENLKATTELQEDIFNFLEGFVQDKRIFEFGVGVGRMTSELAKRAREVVGIDITQEMITRARDILKDLKNVDLRVGKITEFPDLQSKSFDLVFDSIVLLHILNPNELKTTIQKMQELSDTIFIVEHTYEGLDFPISKYSILRKPEEYAELFKPYTLLKSKTHLCAGDTFTMMLFRNET